MDFATKLFSLTLGVEPNKATLKELSGTLNSAVLTLSEKQKALEKYAETAEGQSYVMEAPKEAPKQKPPVVWQISQAKIKELQWKRAQLRQFEREKAARTKTAPSKAPSPKSSQAKRPPKLSSSSSTAAGKQSNPQGDKGTVLQKKSPTAKTSTAPKAKPTSSTPQAAKTKKV